MHASVQILASPPVIWPHSGQWGQSCSVIDSAALERTDYEGATAQVGVTHCDRRGDLHLSRLIRWDEVERPGHGRTLGSAVNDIHIG